MIKNFQESDFIDAFQDLPIYIGNDQSGEMIFKREYSNGLSLTTYLDIYGEKIELTISYPGQNITTFSSHIERVEIKSNVIHFTLFYGKSTFALHPFFRENKARKQPCLPHS